MGSSNTVEEEQAQYAFWRHVHGFDEMHCFSGKTVSEIKVSWSRSEGWE